MAIPMSRSRVLSSRLSGSSTRMAAEMKDSSSGRHTSGTRCPHGPEPRRLSVAATRREDWNEFAAIAAVDRKIHTVHGDHAALSNELGHPDDAGSCKVHFSIRVFLQESQHGCRLRREVERQDDLTRVN